MPATTRTTYSPSPRETITQHKWQTFTIAYLRQILENGGCSSSYFRKYRKRTGGEIFWSTLRGRDTCTSANTGTRKLHYRTWTIVGNCGRHGANSAINFNCSANRGIYLLTVDDRGRCTVKPPRELSHPTAKLRWSR